MLGDLKHELIHIWQEYIATAYRDGEIINERMLEAELFRRLQGQGYPPRQLWLYPKLEFEPTEGVIFDHIGSFQNKQWLKDQEPSILLTRGDEVVGILEVRFSPTAYIDARRPLRRMMSLHQLRGDARIYLPIHPHTGKRDSESLYSISDELLCIFAIITKSGAFGLQTQTLLKEFYDTAFQAHFLHLTASIRPDKITFAYHSPEFG